MGNLKSESYTILMIYGVEKWRYYGDEHLKLLESSPTDSLIVCRWKEKTDWRAIAYWEKGVEPEIYI